MSAQKINADMVIGDVVAQYPATEPVFQKYFGGGCFSCPGAKMESISFGALMHGLDPNAIVNELNQAIEG